MQTPPGVFVWRDVWDHEHSRPSLRGLDCPWCRSTLKGIERVTEGRADDLRSERCLLCRWTMSWGWLDYESRLGPAEPWWSVRVLREFELNSKRLKLSSWRPS